MISSHLPSLTSCLSTIHEPPRLLDGVLVRIDDHGAAVAQLDEDRLVVRGPLQARGVLRDRRLVPGAHRDAIPDCHPRHAQLAILVLPIEAHDPVFAVMRLAYPGVFVAMAVEGVLGDVQPGPMVFAGPIVWAKKSARS